MKLLRISDGRAGHIRLHFDDGSVLKTLPSVVERFALSDGMTLDDAQMDALRDSVSAGSARERAVHIVSAVGVSEKELCRRLVQKGESRADAESAVEWLKELELLDDRRTAEQIVSSAVNRGYGRARIRNLLYEKGIPRALWEEALACVPEMDDVIDRFLHQRLDGREIDDKLIKKTVDALIRKGHGYGDIQDALRRFRADLELEPEPEIEPEPDAF